MKYLKLVIAYEGTNFLGWQKTPLGPTIEESLQRVLRLVLQEPIELQAASRTDAGVHAEGQVVLCCTSRKDLSLAKLHHSLNALLPSSIAVLTLAEIAPSFHPSLDSLGKEYHYYVCNAKTQKPKHRFFSWHVPTSLDLVAMQQAADILIGTHDFSAFCNTEGLLPHKTLCTLHSIQILELPDERLCFQVRGNRFLFRMMRILVGTLVYLGQEKLSKEQIQTLLQTKKRKEAGITAPAHGLHLIKVFYS